MNKFEIRGKDLFNAHRRRIATSSGGAIYDGDNNKVATIRGSDVYDTDQRKMATIRGTDIYDADSVKVGSLSDVQRSIKGAVGEIRHVAFWYCFVR